MTRFAYSAIPIERSGAGLVAGRREASDETSLRDALRSEGLIAVDVRPERLVDALRAQMHPDRLRKADGVWFFQTLALLLENQVPIESAISTLEELAPHARIGRACAEIRKALRSGASLDEAVEAQHGLASAQHVALLRSGLESGRLDHVVKLIDESLSTRARIRRTVIGRLLYPMILLAAAIVVVWFLAVRVIPRFAETLTSLGGVLPWPTQFTLTLAEFLAWGVPALFVAGVIGIAARGAILTPRIRTTLSRLALRIPVLRSLVWNMHAAVITDVLASILSGGGDVLAALTQAHEVVSSPAIGARLAEARAQVREGAELGEAFARAEVLPPVASAVVRSGMKGGDLVGALRRATRLCVESQEVLTQRLLTLMEPAVILILAGAVGWVVYSLVVGMLAITDAGGA
jgi:type II secretory pathway component PulF